MRRMTSQEIVEAIQNFEYSGKDEKEILTELSEKGLVEINRSQDDPKDLDIQLTPNGIKFFTTI